MLKRIAAALVLALIIGASPMMAAHSTTRALFADYHGPLYQVLRPSTARPLTSGSCPTSSE